MAPPQRLPGWQPSDLPSPVGEGLGPPAPTLARWQERLVGEGGAEDRTGGRA